MDTGKIMIGIALVMFSAALMVNPTSAYGLIAQRGGNAVTTSSSTVIAPGTFLSPDASRGGENSWISGSISENQASLMFASQTR